MKKEPQPLWLGRSSAHKTLSPWSQPSKAKTAFRYRGYLHGSSYVRGDGLADITRVSCPSCGSGGTATAVQRCCQRGAVGVGTEPPFGQTELANPLRYNRRQPGRQQDRQIKPRRDTESMRQTRISPLKKKKICLLSADA